MTLRVQAGAAVAEIAPDRGGGVADLRVGDRSILCAGAGRPEGSPFALGLNLLLPFSNRISGPFPFEGQQHAIQPNLSGEPFPIHGDAFQRAWSVQAQAPGEVVLYLSEGRIGPYFYEAQVIYRLVETSFEVVLTVTNRASMPLPFGLGFHPWFPRNAHTRLRFHADGHWPQDDRFLPTTVEPVPVPPEWRFDAPSPLPSGWINTAFSGWDSQIELDQDDAAVPLCIRAPGLTTLIVYSLGAEFPFVCLEPVSHPVDAHNLPGQPGLVPLSTGDSRSGTMILTWDPPSGARLHAGSAEALSTLSTPSAAS